MGRNGEKRQIASAASRPKNQSGIMVYFVNKPRTTLTELEKVERWLEKKQCEQNDMRAEFKHTHNFNLMAKITENCTLMSQAHSWLATQRIAAFNQEAK